MQDSAWIGEEMGRESRPKIANTQTGMYLQGVLLFNWAEAGKEAGAFGDLSQGGAQSRCLGARLLHPGKEHSENTRFDRREWQRAPEGLDATWTRLLQLHLVRSGSFLVTWARSPRVLLEAS